MRASKNSALDKRKTNVDKHGHKKQHWAAKVSFFGSQDGKAAAIPLTICGKEDGVQELEDLKSFFSPPVNSLDEQAGHVAAVAFAETLCQVRNMSSSRGATDEGDAGLSTERLAHLTAKWKLKTVFSKSERSQANSLGAQNAFSDPLAADMARDGEEADAVHWEAPASPSLMSTISTTASRSISPPSSPESRMNGCRCSSQKGGFLNTLPEFSTPQTPSEGTPRGGYMATEQGIHDVEEADGDEGTWAIKLRSDEIRPELAIMLDPREAQKRLRRPISDQELEDACVPKPIHVNDFPSLLLLSDMPERLQETHYDYFGRLCPSLHVRNNDVRRQKIEALRNAFSYKRSSPDRSLRSSGVPCVSSPCSEPPSRPSSRTLRQRAYMTPDPVPWSARGKTPNVCIPDSDDLGKEFSDGSHCNGRRTPQRTSSKRHVVEPAGKNGIARKCSLDSALVAESGEDLPSESAGRKSNTMPQRSASSCGAPRTSRAGSSSPVCARSPSRDDGSARLSRIVTPATPSTPRMRRRSSFVESPGSYRLSPVGIRTPEPFQTKQEAHGTPSEGCHKPCRRPSRQVMGVASNRGPVHSSRAAPFRCGS